MIKIHKTLLLQIVLAFIFFCGCTNSTSIKLDSSKNFYLQFGRGSGWHGLDTIEIKETGVVTMYRANKNMTDKGFEYFWEKTTNSLNSSSIKKIATKINELELCSMNARYHANVNDGTQWILWLKQDGQEKSIYFDNNFPGSIKKFAEFIDNELKNAGADKANWVRVPKNESRDHEKDIWNIIRQN